MVWASVMIGLFFVNCSIAARATPPRCSLDRTAALDFTLRWHSPLKLNLIDIHIELIGAL